MKECVCACTWVSVCMSRAAITHDKTDGCLKLWQGG
jgi:hypothetical protein